MNFKDVLVKDENFVKLKNNLANTPLSVSGIAESCLAHFIYSIAENETALIVTSTDAQAKNLYFDLCFFSDAVLYFPTKEYIYYDIDAVSRFTEQKRIDVLEKIKSESGHITVTSYEALCQYTISPEIFSDCRIEIKNGTVLNIENLSKQLVEMGYTRDDTVEGCGQFCIRGGIIDIFSPASDQPYRIELFDDEVESVRVYDYVSQRTLNTVECCTILPCREAVINEQRRSKIADAIDEKIKKLKRKKGDFTAIIKTLSDDREKIMSAQRDFAAIDKYAPFIYDRLYTILDYFENSDMIFVYEPKKIAERTRSLSAEFGENILSLSEQGLIAADSKNLIIPFEEYIKKSSSMRHISVNSLNHTTISYKYKAIFDFNSRKTVSLHGKLDYLTDDLVKWQKENKTVVILAKNRSRAENITGVLNDKGINAKFIKDKANFVEGEISVAAGEINKGFEYPDIGFVLICEQEIFNTEKRRQRRRIDNTKRIKAYTDINIGDYVVHQAHGIGRYLGLKRMTVSGVTKDYLKIQYYGTDSLYIPVDQMDMLYKYIGSTDKEVKLNRLSTNEWNKTKQRVKKATADIAKQLIALYAERSKAKGFAFAPDGPWQRDFENTFEYEETDDQLRSIEEVKSDMESQKPMDRLLCGDVGYGKTEVALRAAFKAAVNSKQVAYLCPTTVLAMQHYDTFSSRMNGFAIKTEMLSRFRTPTQQKKILKDVKSGAVDILIGTHRLLQKDVEFKDLGLLIIDEEQRFGVAAKEKLKELKKNIDVLSMTATPIPRTLHMSMINIRDMSVLETPPENRYPVQTYVLEYNEAVVVQAMKRELSRGGQVFFLNNRVENIYSVAARIKELIPEARVSVGHGKMHEDELEDIMYDMVNGKTDILVCTTIIETGLDIPNANTIIVNNADKMGLAQLYQLRGRVGRSDRVAYAYFTYRRDKVLSEVAQKRLMAVKEFTEFGSGFKIAMRDLEIRGAGNLLGAQQHGHMDAVGYDMYCKLLNESIGEERGEISQKPIETTVDFDCDAYIPEKYIQSQEQRIDIYKKIAAVSSEEDVLDITDELCDMYSNPPAAVLNLINIAYIKSMANSVGITEINAKRNTVVFRFAKDMTEPEICIELIRLMPKEISVSASAIPTLIYRNTDKYKLFDNIKFVLQSVIRLKNEQK